MANRGCRCRSILQRSPIGLMALQTISLRSVGWFTSHSAMQRQAGGLCTEAASHVRIALLLIGFLISNL